MLTGVAFIRKVETRHVRTAGLHLHNRLLHSLRPAELKAIHPRRRLRPYVAASPLTVAEETGGNDTDGAGGPVVPCATYLWGALLRVDVMEAGPDVRLVFVGTGAMEVRACQLLDADCELALAQASTGARPLRRRWLLARA